jgi:ATP adenylyltransferase
VTGHSDAFDRLWTPHRLAYIRGENKPVTPDAGADCPFCRAPGLAVGGSGVDDSLVVARGIVSYVTLNRYPYNAGHLLVVPYRHIADYTELTDTETAELATFTRDALRVLRAVSAPQGFNLGTNLGGVAGAGIAAHLHQHIVPRWGGDTNFMPVVASTRVLPQLLAETREILSAAWPRE